MEILRLRVVKLQLVIISATSVINVSGTLFANMISSWYLLCSRTLGDRCQHLRIDLSSVAQANLRRLEWGFFSASVYSLCFCCSFVFEEACLIPENFPDTTFSLHACDTIKNKCFEAIYECCGLHNIRIYIRPSLRWLCRFRWISHNRDARW